MAPTPAFKAFAVKEKGGKLEPFEYNPEPLGPNDIEIKPTHNGLCHSDYSMQQNEWGITTFPFVPGHEVVGVVEEVGSAVTHLKKGDRVGYGWNTDCCQRCRRCVRGQDNLCEQGPRATIVGHYGGFANRMRAPSTLAVKIPEGMESANAAPLLCAGVTVFSPLRKYITTPGMKVGIVSIGGLGHLALQFANALGAEVYALSRSDKKKEEALNKFGAHHFMTFDQAKEQIGGQLSLILSTAPKGLDYNLMVELLDAEGRLVLLGGHVEKLDVPVGPLIFGEKSIAGSLVGGRVMMEEMLRVASLHKVAPMVEPWPLSKCDEAMQKLEKEGAQYRIVLETDI